MSGAVSHGRRRLLGAAGVVTAEVAFMGISRASSGAAAGPASPLGPTKRVEAGVPEVGYHEAGPGDGPPVLLLHGFPYSVGRRRGPNHGSKASA